MKHTATPWSINKQALGLIESASAHRSCASASSYSDGSQRAHEENEANAAFIVKACNNHYQLLEALKELVSLKNHKFTHGKDDEYMNRQPKAWAVAREAIRDAEAES